MKDTDFSHVARVVADRHGFFYVCGKGGVHVPDALKVNAVAVNSSGFGD